MKWLFGLISLLTLLLTFTFLQQAAASKNETQVSSSRSPLETEEAARHRTCQPRHWRALVMHPR